MKLPRILIVEDDSISRFMISEMCEQLGYRFETATGGADCIAMLTEDSGRADIILMDIHMPGMSGLDACGIIRNAATHPPRRVPIVAVTADEHWHIPENCAAAGFDTVLPKPISIDALQGVLVRLA